MSMRTWSTDGPHTPDEQHIAGSNSSTRRVVVVRTSGVTWVMWRVDMVGEDSVSVM